MASKLWPTKVYMTLTASPHFPAGMYAHFFCFSASGQCLWVEQKEN